MHNPQGAYIPGEEIRHADKHLLNETVVSAEGQPEFRGGVLEEEQWTMEGATSEHRKASRGT